jgi:hypothetical protein
LGELLEILVMPGEFQPILNLWESFYKEFANRALFQMKGK